MRRAADGIGLSSINDSHVLTRTAVRDSAGLAENHRTALAQSIADTPREWPDDGCQTCVMCDALSLLFGPCAGLTWMTKMIYW